MDWEQVANAIESAGLFGAFALWGVMGYRKVWRWGYVVDAADKIWKERLDECRKDRDEWKRMCLTNLAVAERMAERGP